MTGRQPWTNGPRAVAIYCALPKWPVERGGRCQSPIGPIAMSTIRALALLLIVAIVCAACNLAAMNQPVVDDNEITVYTSLPSDIVGGYLADFEERYPAITIHLVNEVTLDLVQRLIAEQDEPQADVVWGLAVSSMLTLEWNSILAMYTPVGIERLDPLFLDGKQPPQWVGISARSIGLCVNEAELDKRNLPEPTSWQDLINPIYHDN
ncbi:MAG: ABC transporter substrate-binding protein [Caldilineaceae bacterium]|nr:ABC transporter substrate-binding protein [Caldilineaceae bacterium]